MCDIGDLEPCEVWSERTVKARKSHVCSCCGGAINPGEHYTKHFSVYEGDVTSEKMCSHCTEASEEFMEVHHTRGCPSYMPDLISDCIHEEELYGDTEMAAKWQKVQDAMEARKEARVG